MARIVLDRISKTFSGPKREQITALSNLCLTIEDGELLAVVGPSGSGKTTTLRLIAGLDRPSSGTICLDSQKINDLPAKDRDVAMIFQSSALYPHLNGFENIALGLKLRKVSKSDMMAKVREAAEMLGIQPLLGRLPSALSGGEQQRVALARALVRRPKAFLLDEPLSHLDAPLQERLRSEIVSLHRRLGTTMVYITHDQIEAMSLGQRVAVLREGRLQQVDTPAAIYRHPANIFVASFIGSPAMNFFQGLILRAATGLMFRQATESEVQTSSCPLSLPIGPSLVPSLTAYIQHPVALGLRPEAFTILRSNDSACGHPIISCMVERLEPLGPETYLHLRHGESRFTARTAGFPSVKANETISVAIDMSQARFFDPSTTNAISCPLSEL